ncbi:hypothetical protein KI387_042086, partial [Taxus chinensis]
RFPEEKDDCIDGMQDQLKKVDSLPMVLFVATSDEWYSDITFFLTYGECPAHLTSKEKRTVKLRAARYVIWDDGLYKRGIDGIFLRCVDKPQQVKLLEIFHDSACGGHFSSSVTAHKIIRARYYWPMLFRDTATWVAKCELCQQFVGKPKLAAFPLRPVVIDQPFKQWGIDFIGALHPQSSAGHSYVLTATDYFTKWVEAIPVKNATSEIVCNFIKENIIVRFGIPHKIIADNASNFSSREVISFFYEYGITLAHASDYYPQGNDRITPKRSLSMSPFQVLYGIDAELPISTELPTLRLARAIEDETFQNSLEKRVMYLVELEEKRVRVVDRITEHQNQVKRLFDKKAKQRDFQ